MTSEDQIAPLPMDENGADGKGDENPPDAVSPLSLAPLKASQRPARMVSPLEYFQFITPCVLRARAC
jgi:hypothetical protein